MEPEPLTPMQCRKCCSTPAAAVTFRAVAGVVLAFRSETIEGPFCRDCGTELFRRATAHTLAFAWWSPLSFLLGPIVVIRNVRARRRVAALAAPSDPARGFRPMRVGRPVWQRPQIAGLLAPIGVIVGLVLITLATPSTDLHGPSDNQCVALDQAAYGVMDDGAPAHVVDCGQPHDGRIRLSDTPINGDSVGTAAGRS